MERRTAPRRAAPHLCDRAFTAYVVKVETGKQMRKGWETEEV